MAFFLLKQLLLRFSHALLLALFPYHQRTAIFFKYLSALIRQAWIPLKCMFASSQGGINVGSSASTESLKIWVSTGLMGVSFVLDYPSISAMLRRVLLAAKQGTNLDLRVWFVQIARINSRH
ncbi:hypothetical protein B0H13DRAFT_2277227 [Mycena leptocephala]|nr:hypothetical protein B0H13DRAFT_2277227 [Mycena leptocephala]